MNTESLQVEPLTTEQPVTVRTCRPIKGWTCAAYLTVTGLRLLLNGMPPYNRSTLSNSPLSLEIQQLSGSTEYIDPPNAPALIPVSALATCKEGRGEVPVGAWYTDGSSQDNPPTWMALAI